MNTKTVLLKWSQICLEYCLTCNAECAHCCVESSPRRKEKMGVERAKRMIDEASKLPSIREVGIGGGEPLLFFDEVLEIMRHARDRHGHSTTITTNSFWGTSVAAASKKIALLKEAGLRSFLISVDDFHTEYIALERVKNVLTAAHEQDVHCYVQSIVSKTSRKTEDFQRELGTFDGRFSWGSFPCIPVGFAKLRVPSDELIGERGVPREGCTVSRLLRVKVDGSVKPCCGAGVPDRLIVGNLDKEPIEKIVARIEADPILNAIALWRGPRYLAQILKEEGHPELSERMYAGACHACGIFLNDPRLLDIITTRLQADSEQLRRSREDVEREHYFPANYHLTRLSAEPARG